MDLKQTPTNDSRLKVSLSITSALASAVLEWLLIVMLLFNAGFSYLIAKCARCWGLQIPCLLCSRLDHVLGNERTGFHWDLICRNHKLKISSLILCQLHNNLVDVHQTCESCLFSFATIGRSNAETYRLLVGKLGAEPHCGVALDVSSDENKVGSSNTRKCTCCHQQWIPRTYTQKLCHNKSIDSGEEIPSSDTSKYNRDDVPERADESSQFDHTRNKDADSLPRVEYKKIKVTSSDSESDSPSSINRSASAVNLEIGTLVQDSQAIYESPEPQLVTLADSSASENLIHPAPLVKSVSESKDTNDFVHVESEAPLGHGIEEINLQQGDHNNDVAAPFDLVPSSETLHSTIIEEIHRYESKETNVASSTELDKEVHIESGEASNMGIDPTSTAESQKEVIMECRETSMVRSDSIPASETEKDAYPNNIDTSLEMAESLDICDAYKLAVGARGRQLSGRLLEKQRSMTDSRRASEDLKLLLSQISAVRGFEFSSNDMSPRVCANNEDSKHMDASGAIGMHILQRRISLERNESNLSLDGSTISEVEGESVVDRLKRQLEHDKKIMATLYKELEDERNASADAVNQAMAMITRLQEEKAALHMEALQCLRMMEQQAEYDGEAIQKANDLLTEKEKQIQDLEAELELYQNQFGDTSLSSSVFKPRPESDAGELKVQKLEVGAEESNATSYHNSDNYRHYNINGDGGAASPGKKP